MAKTVELLSRYTPFRLYYRTCPVNSTCASGSSANGIGPAGSSRAAGYKPVANSAGADSTYTFACVFTSPSVPIPPLAIHALHLRDLNTTQITTKTNTPTAANPPIDTPTIDPVERPPFPGPFSSPPFSLHPIPATYNLNPPPLPSLPLPILPCASSRRKMHPQRVRIHIQTPLHPGKVITQPIIMPICSLLLRRPQIKSPVLPAEVSRVGEPERCTTRCAGCVDHVEGEGWSVGAGVQSVEGGSVGWG